MRPPEPLVHAARGVLMGAADIVPGVSGGTVALIVGIYDRLVRSVGALARTGAALLALRFRAAREHVRDVDLRLLIPLALGVVAALGLGSLVIPPLLDGYPAETSAAFFGLIAASLPLPWGRIERPTRRLAAVVGVAAVTAFVLAGLPPREIVDPALPIVFLSAMVALCAMILPGLSGAYLLLILGVYGASLTALRSGDVVYVATFAAGGVLGLGLFSRLLDHLLTHRHDVTMAALVGLMAGALRALWPWQTEDRELLAVPLEAQTLTTVGVAVAAFVLLRLVVRLGTRAAAGSSPPAR
ncbi:DUF368 domain-containing protein [Egibacter rhizosphaerae]|uniref:DUF368 domain-containing protein n=1 Tax=Egibacter rhizosphaerae TaxID=1670831 RepID=A0A411YAQ6_9ACTN|nr:DUF368 domain-containing protein [Egibacter rhizosphaerae]QBI18259.1 DUF368 domain-containing protein [Egibacter rhizosphaerae]